MSAITAIFVLALANHSTPLTTPNNSLGPVCDSIRVLNAGQFNGYRHCLCRSYVKELQVDGTSVSHQVLAEHVRRAIRTLCPGISNHQMAKSLADALALHISRPPESIINYGVIIYCHKALAILLQVNQPRYWSGGGWAVRCPNATRGMRGEILPLERSGPPGQMRTWLPPGASIWKFR